MSISTKTPDEPAPTNERLKVLVTRPNQFTYSETFIENHIRFLPCEVISAWGKWVPRQTDSGILFGWAPLLWLEDRFNDFTGSSVCIFRLRRFKKFLKEQKPDVVLAEYGLGGGAMAPICNALGIPLVCYFLGLDGYGFKILKRWKSRYQFLFEKASAIVAVSKDMKTQLASLGCEADKIEWVVCGINPTFTQLEVNTTPRPPVFLSVGRFVEKKAPLLMVRSFAKVVKAVPQARLISYGDGPLWEESKMLANSLGISHSIEFRGKGKPADIAHIMQQVVAFVQHSVRAQNGDSEGTPVAILEASASGLPIISTRHAGIKDTVIDGKTGILVDEHDEAAFADAMLELAQYPEKALKMGQEGRMYVLNNFALEKTIADLYQILLTASAKHNNIGGR